jgi:hypothetical protein
MSIGLFESAAAERIIYENDLFYFINTQNYILLISKDSGMLESARLKDSSFEIAADYPGFSLFFTEFGLQLPDSMYEIFTNSELKTFGGTVTATSFEDENFARLEFVWDNPYIQTCWDYNFIPDQKYFIINLKRLVKTSAVYSNHQQCVMANSDFDNTFLVNYEGEWFQAMAKGNVGPGAMEGSASFQHSMYTAIDYGKSHRFPALGWYQSQYDVTFGIIVPWVSANQRMTIAYHGGGRTPQPRHPGFSECQIDWFGKADSEALLLNAGTEYAMKMVYYLGIGSIDSLDQLNCALFNNSHFDTKRCQDYSVASWGGRRAYLRQYTWTFPQASSNYINTQELFEHRAVSIPGCQNGSPWPHLFDIQVIHQHKNGQKFDLSPIPKQHGRIKLFEKAENQQGNAWFEGSVTWLVDSLNNRLCYRIYPESDKLTVSGQITALVRKQVGKLYICLPFSDRVKVVKKLTDYIWDIRANDTICGEIGITLYDLEGISAVESDVFELRLVIDTPAQATDTMRTWNYQFRLFPHRDTRVEGAGEITPFFSKPEEWYREYYVSYPALLKATNWGICPDFRLTFIDAEVTPDSTRVLSTKIYAQEGNYGISFFFKETPVKAIYINDHVLNRQSWHFQSDSGVVHIQQYWEGLTKIDFYQQASSGTIEAGVARDLLTDNQNKNFNLSIFPNPFNSGTQLKIELPLEQDIFIGIYNLSGQLVGIIHRGFLNAGLTFFRWNGTDFEGKALSSGIYFIAVRSKKICQTQRILLIR